MSNDEENSNSLSLFILGRSGSESPANTVDLEARLLSVALDPVFLSDLYDQHGVAAIKCEQKVKE